MVLTFSTGKIIANHHEVVIKMVGDSKITLQAQTDDITLFGSANVIVASGSGINWSVHLDNQQQIIELSEVIGVALR
ncbi:MAG: DUF3389 domain-containing protein [Aliivibrio sp.]|uniref:DUF3389 family protein n=1 Tax=Aliivibrio sp. TaxID=1872443 RepID=UPI001A3E18DC|nr:DUF3389 domain-containing protein [Aliivibrio sp.]